MYGECVPPLVCTKDRNRRLTLKLQYIVKVYFLQVDGLVCHCNPPAHADLYF